MKNSQLLSQAAAAPLPWHRFNAVGKPRSFPAAGAKIL